MDMNDRDGLTLTLLFVVIFTIPWQWTPLDFYTSLVLAGVVVVSLTVPKQSIIEGVRFLQNGTGVHWMWWVLWVVCVLVVINVTQYLGAPDVFIERRGRHREIPIPTRYGIGTLALACGGLALVLVSNYASVYRTLRRRLPFETPSSGRMTVEGTARPEEEPLRTPIEGAPALWYRYQVTKEQDGLFQWPRLPVASGERSIRWSVAGQTQKTVIDTDRVQLLPDRTLPKVRTEDCTVSPDEPLPPGLARLEQSSANGNPNADRTTDRRYRVWYLPVEESVVAHGPTDPETPGSSALGGDGNTVSVAVGKTYDEIRSQLAFRTAFAGGLGLVLTAIGALLIALEMPLW